VNDRSLDRIERVFRWTLRLCPRAFRERFGEAKTEAFVERVRARRRGHGRISATATGTGGILNTAWQGLELTTLMAAWAPSRRAGRVNPVELLREQ
jgi:hypothetical protein